MRLAHTLPDDNERYLPPRDLRAPTDVITAYQLFGANCGPASFAALLSLQTCDVIQFFEHFEWRKFTTFRDMTHALGECGIDFITGSTLPDFGLALIQIEGPWTHMTGAARWSDRYTHWIGLCGNHIYDINTGEWTPLVTWTERIVTSLIAETRHATGWSVKRSLQVPEQPFCPVKSVPGLAFY